MDERDIALDDIRKAAERLEPIIHKTELDLSATFSRMTGGEIYLKCENRQKTGSFKIRGASNKIAKMIEEGDRSPVVASSAGNHAQGVASAATRFGLKATIVMPQTSPLAKIEATRGYGADVVLAGECYDDAYARAVEICETTGATFLHPYDDSDVIAGQGTIGLEILDELPDVDAIVVPAGGGGLLAGVACAVKQVNPQVEVIGVQSEHADAIAKSFREKKHLSTTSSLTIADGIAVKNPGDLTVELINKHVDDVVTVSDTQIADAILLLVERCKLVVEPAGAASLAAVLNGKLDVAGKKIVCLLSGGNIDVSFIQSIIERGLVARHRRVGFSVTILDRPSSFSSLLASIAEQGANVLAIEQNKLATKLEPNEAKVDVICEVGGPEHQEKLISKLEELGYKLESKD